MTSPLRHALIAAATVLGVSIASSVPTPMATGTPTPRTVAHVREVESIGSLPRTPKSPIHHFVTLLQENHSFDNYFGSFPGADGIPKYVCMPTDPVARPPGECVTPYSLDGKATPRINLDHEVLLRALDGGKLDGFVAAQSGSGVVEPGAMGTYDAKALTFYWALAHRYVLFDRFFSSADGGTLWNHLAWIGASKEGLTNEGIPRTGLDGTTIFDQLQATGVSWKIYVENYDPQVTIGGTDDLNKVQLARVPVLSMPRFVDDPELMSHVVPLSEYDRDLAAGQLPAVSYVVPSGSSEHPPSTPRSGQLMASRLIGALERSTAWSSSAFLISYDDAGGWYDHVPPPEPGMGLRVPAILASPYAAAGVVHHQQFETASIPQFVEDNWGLAPVASTQPTSTHLMRAFDFSRAPRKAEAIPFRPVASDPVLPGRGLTYPLYGGALVLAVVAFAAAVLIERRRRRDAPPGQPHDPLEPNVGRLA